MRKLFLSTFIACVLGSFLGSLSLWGLSFYKLSYWSGDADTSLHLTQGSLIVGYWLDDSPTRPLGWMLRGYDSPRMLYWLPHVGSGRFHVRVPMWMLVAASMLASIPMILWVRRKIIEYERPRRVGLALSGGMSLAICSAWLVSGFWNPTWFNLDRTYRVQLQRGRLAWTTGSAANSPRIQVTPQDIAAANALMPAGRNITSYEISQLLGYEAKIRAQAAPDRVARWPGRVAPQVTQDTEWGYDLNNMVEEQFTGLPTLPPTLKRPNIALPVFPRPANTPAVTTIGSGLIGLGGGGGRGAPTSAPTTSTIITPAPPTAPKPPWFTWPFVRGGGPDLEVFVPIWMPLVPALMATLFFFAPGVVISRRRRLGRCVRCTYDLRASGERCPECGHLDSKRTNTATNRPAVPASA